MAKKKSSFPVGVVDMAFRKARVSVYGNEKTRFWFPLACRLEPVYIQGEGDLPLGFPLPAAKLITATDGKHLFVGVDRFMEATEKERVGLVVHEVQHCAFDHLGRVGTRDPWLFNAVSDISLHAHTEAAGLDVPPVGLDAAKSLLRAAKLHTSFREHAEISVEALYTKIIAAMPPPPEETHICLVSSSSLSPEEKEEVRAAWSAALEEQMLAASPGTVPLGVSELIEAKRARRRDWCAEFRSELSAMSQAWQEWLPPNRRFVWQGLYLPGRVRRNFPRIGFVLDTSGSMSSGTLARAWGEMLAFRDIVPCELWLLQQDCELASETFYAKGESLPDVLEVCGRGGTDLNPAIHRLDEMQLNLIVVLTDMQFSIDPEPTKTPCVWLAWGREVAPYGKTIRVEEAKECD